MMPYSCWDGKNLDTPNHMDHVAHPTDGPASFAMVDGPCPASHPVKIPQVHYEVCGQPPFTAIIGSDIVAWY
jgi:hypothetical protein